MKKVIAILMVLATCFALIACGGPDRQPAIDAFNEAKNAFNEVAIIINSDIESYDEELVDVMIEMAGVLEQHKNLLEGDEELTQEKLDEMIAWYDTVKEWAADVKTVLANVSDSIG